MNFPTFEEVKRQQVQVLEELIAELRESYDYDDIKNTAHDIKEFGKCLEEFSELKIQNPVFDINKSVCPCGSKPSIIELDRYGASHKAICLDCKREVVGNCEDEALRNFMDKFLDKFSVSYLSAIK